MEKARRGGAIACMAAAVLALVMGPGAKGSVQVSSAQADTVRMLIPGGQVVGVALKTQGVLVVSRMSRQEINTPLRVGDVILSVQGKEIASAQELAQRLQKDRPWLDYCPYQALPDYTELLQHCLEKGEEL